MDVLVTAALIPLGKGLIPTPHSAGLPHADYDMNVKVIASGQVSSEYNSVGLKDQEKYSTNVPKLIPKTNIESKNFTRISEYDDDSSSANITPPLSQPNEKQQNMLTTGIESKNFTRTSEYDDDSSSANITPPLSQPNEKQQNMLTTGIESKNFTRTSEYDDDSSSANITPPLSQPNEKKKKVLRPPQADKLGTALESIISKIGTLQYSSTLQIKLRKATSKDLNVVLQLIQQHVGAADLEEGEEEDGQKALSAEALHKVAWGTNQSTVCICLAEIVKSGSESTEAVQENDRWISSIGCETVGVSFYCQGFSVFHGATLDLEAVLVRPKYRRLGIGSLFIQVGVTLATELGVGAGRWNGVSEYVTHLCSHFSIPDSEVGPTSKLEIETSKLQHISYVPPAVTDDKNTNATEKQWKEPNIPSKGVNNQKIMNSTGKKRGWNDAFSTAMAVSLMS